MDGEKKLQPLIMKFSKGYLPATLNRLKIANSSIVLYTLEMEQCASVHMLRARTLCASRAHVYTRAYVCEEREGERGRNRWMDGWIDK